MAAGHSRAEEVDRGLRAGAIALGIGLEYLQLWSGWRDFEIGDMVADAVGVVCGLVAAAPVRRRLFAYPRKPYAGQ